MKRSLVALALVSAVLPADAYAGSVLQVEGTHTTQVVPCASLCTTSEFVGDLEATSNFTLISLTTSRVPDVSRYIGNLVLHTVGGDLIGQDIGWWNTVTGDFVDVYYISEGTGTYADAAGLLLLWGTLDPLTGTGSSQYSGYILVP